MRGQRWFGVICCFVLFVGVFLSQKLMAANSYPGDKHSEWGMLFFILPGVIASVFSRHGRVIKPLMGAVLASPLCLLIIHFWLSPTRTFWQEMAWMFSAVFWCALGALCYLFVRTALRRQRR